jgi:proline dehydrogenase
LLIDGEESWMQDAADDLVTEMMRKYNKRKKPLFSIHLQMYRWDRGLPEKITRASKKRGLLHWNEVVRG